jgi:hypothetical protein
MESGIRTLSNWIEKDEDQYNRKRIPWIANISPLPGAALALANPPADIETAIEYIRHDAGFHYDILLGWHVSRREGRGAHCLSAPLVGDVYHTLITGQSRAGKDNLALNAILGLAMVYSPEKVQFCIIDGKGLDFCGFEGKAHTWRLALEPREIAPAMEALTREREHRGKLLRAAQVSKWEAFKGDNIPLLVVYVSELSLLEGAVGKRQLTDWLNQELAAGAAFGIRYIIATQTASNFDTRWRSQISLYLAAFQPSQSQDQPNTGLTTNEIKTANGVPPSELPAPPKGTGVFTCVQGRSCHTVRAGLMDDEQRKMLLKRLPVSTVSTVYTVPDKDNDNNERVPFSDVLEEFLATNPPAEKSVISLSNEGNKGNGQDNDNGHETNDNTSDSTGDNVEITDEEIYLLLQQGVARREIAKKLRGKMQKRMARIAEVEDRMEESRSLRLVK